MVPDAVPAVSELTGMGVDVNAPGVMINTCRMDETTSAYSLPVKPLSMIPLALPTKVMLVPVNEMSPPDETFVPLSRLKLPPAEMVAVLLMSATAAIGNARTANAMAMLAKSVLFSTILHPLSRTRSLTFPGPRHDYQLIGMAQEIRCW